MRRNQSRIMGIILLSFPRRRESSPHCSRLRNQLWPNFVIMRNGRELHWLENVFTARPAVKKMGKEKIMKLSDYNKMLDRIRWKTSIEFNHRSLVSCCSGCPCCESGEEEKLKLEKIANKIKALPWDNYDQVARLYYIYLVGIRELVVLKRHYTEKMEQIEMIFGIKPTPLQIEEWRKEIFES